MRFAPLPQVEQLQQRGEGRPAVPLLGKPTAHQPRRETGLRRIFLLLSSVGLLLALAVPALANQPAEHSTEDVTGDTIQCEGAVYTITSGTIRIVAHEGTSASGNTNFTVTLTPQNVLAVDEAGNQYSIVGAVWFGGT